jgi:beta-lactamase superfamily II metal-dependent hydrolase
LLFGGWLKSTPVKLFTAVVFAAVAALYLIRLETTHSETSLTILPLNGGKAIFAASPKRTDDLLIDCGNAQAAESTLKEFLRAQGVNHLPQLILTTGEVRNSGGVTNLDQMFAIGNLWTSPAGVHSSRYQESIATFEHPTDRHHLAKRGDTIGAWSVLYPDVKESTAVSRADDNALVLKATINHTRILLLSDLNRAGQDNLLILATTKELHADIVITGLPSGGEPLCHDLILAIQPQAIVIVDSEFPAQRRASRSLHERLAGQNVPVIYTRDHGALTLLIEQNNWQLSAPDGTSIQVPQK